MDGRVVTMACVVGMDDTAGYASIPVSSAADIVNRREVVELDAIKLLEPDDVLTIPSLVTRGLVWFGSPTPAVHLAAAGAVYADELTG